MMGDARLFNGNYVCHTKEAFSGTISATVDKHNYVVNIYLFFYIYIYISYFMVLKNKSVADNRNSQSSSSTQTFIIDCVEEMKS